jgi:hypothetical protein
MKNLDAYHDGLMAKHNEDYEYDPPWTVADYEGEGGGYLVVNESGDSDGDWYDTEAQAQAVANRLNKEAMEGNDDFYID